MSSQLTNKFEVVSAVTGELVTLYEPTILQAAFHAKTEPNALFYGGRGSGKSLALRMEAHIRALANPGFKYAILRRTIPQLRASHINDLRLEMKVLGGHFNESSKIAEYPNGAVGFFRPCNDQKDVLDLLSAEFGAMYFDELSTFEWDMFTQLAASARIADGKFTQEYAVVRAATNPLGPSAEKVMQYFVTKDVGPEEDPEYNPADWTSVKANLADNPHVSASYLKRFAGMSEKIRKAWIDGEFTSENSLFDFYPAKEGREYHVVTDIDWDRVVKASQIYRVFDYGWFPDPSYCAWIAHIGNRFIVLNEQLWYKANADEIARDIKNIDTEMKISRVVATYCDPSMDVHHGNIVTTKDLFETCGIPMDNSVNDRERFASSFHQALGQEVMPGIPRLQIYGPRCPYLVKSIPQQRYNPKRPMAMADSSSDHAVVAVAYFLISHGSLDRPTIVAPTLPRWMQPTTQKKRTLGSEGVRRH